MRIAKLVLTQIACGATLVFTSATATAATITVTPTDSYDRIENADPGDVVEIEPGTYKFRVHLTKTATGSNPIVIRAADPSNPPVWDLDGQLVEDWPGSYAGGDRGRGCWQVRGAHYQISGVVFQNCRNAGRNSSGIRYHDSKDLTIRDVVFRNSDNGLTGTGTNTVVEFCEFDSNGHPQAVNPTHNIYVFGGSLAVRYSYLHDPVQGQNFHIRAVDSVLENNWIARAKSYEGDIMTSEYDDPPHARMIFRGNVVLGNPSPVNGSQVIALYNDSGAANVRMDIRVLFNTFVIQASSNPRIVNLHNGSMDQASALISNNIIVGTTRPYEATEPGTSNFDVTGSNNWLSIDANAGQLAATIVGASPGFSNAGALDFTLSSGSTAIGRSIALAGDAPTAEYYRDETLTRRYRLRASLNDVGAFESTTTGSGTGPYDPAPDGGSGTGGTSGAGGGGAGSGGASAAAGTGGTSAGGTSGANAGGASGSSSGGAGGKGTGASSGSGASRADSGADDDSGCGCRTSSERRAGSAALLLLLVAGSRWRRRSRGRHPR